MREKLVSTGGLEARGGGLRTRGCNPLFSDRRGVHDDLGYPR
jgi:hypothetical protein